MILLDLGNTRKHYRSFMTNMVGTYLQRHAPESEHDANDDPMYQAQSFASTRMSFMFETPSLLTHFIRGTPSAEYLLGLQRPLSEFRPKKQCLSFANFAPASMA